MSPYDSLPTAKLRILLRLKTNTKRQRCLCHTELLRRRHGGHQVSKNRTSHSAGSIQG